MSCNEKWCLGNNCIRDKLLNLLLAVVYTIVCICVSAWLYKDSEDVIVATGALLWLFFVGVIGFNIRRNI